MGHYKYLTDSRKFLHITIIDSNLLFSNIFTRTLDPQIRVGGGCGEGKGEGDLAKTGQKPGVEQD